MLELKYKLGNIFIIMPQTVYDFLNIDVKSLKLNFIVIKIRVSIKYIKAELF